jgi:hypothetical protein
VELEDVLGSLSKEWIICFYGQDTPLILLGFEYETLAMRSPTDAAEHGV